MTHLRIADHDITRRPVQDPPTKVLHIINGDLYAGAERVQELLADRLPSFGYEVSFVCLKEGAFQRALEAGPREVVTVAMRSRFDMIRTALRIARRARDSGSQLIHTHTSRGALIGSLTAAITGLPMTHHVHSPTIRDTTNAWTNGANALVERASLLRVAALIPVSDSLAHYLTKQGYPARRIHTVPNGVAASDLHTSRELHDDLKLGMVALFRPRKGIEVLLQAMSLMIRRGQRVQLLAIGGFEKRDYERQVLALTEQLGLSAYVQWCGFQTDVLQELTGVDALVLPSLFGEGMPMVVLEAMAVGLPIIASAVEGVPEVVRDGQDGFLVPPNDVESLAATLLRLLDDRAAARSMGDAARQRQRSLYSDNAMAAGVSEIYDRLLGRSAVPLQVASI